MAPTPTETPGTGRFASPQAWRRLRQSMTDAELRDIARDISAETTAEYTDVYYALAVIPWDRRTQL